MVKARPLILMALLATGTALSAHLLLGAGPKTPAVAAKGAEAAPAPSVLAVKAALPPGHIIRPDDLEPVRWAGGAPPPGAILAGGAEAGALAGAVTRRAFAPGELILPGSVIRPGERGFLAALVTPGYRAVAVSVDAATAAGGLIWPGDRVDIILTQEIRADGVPLPQQVVSETILADVRILSTDQKLDPASHAAGPVEGAVEPRGVPATITVEVRPEDAGRLTVAATLGRLNLALRGVAAGAEPGGAPAALWAGAVSPALAAVRQRPAAALSAPPVAHTAGPRPEPPREAGVRIFRGSAGA